jgi:hypothetical protein
MLEKEFCHSRSERIRQLIDLALSSARQLQSKQTGYLHYCYHPIEEERYDTIPILENFLFSLLLLRTRTVENVLEAKEMIERLLHFQSQTGNFPVYLHEFPQCHDRLIGLPLLPALYWIAKDFGQVLGKELFEKIALAATALLNICLNEFEDQTLPYALSIRLAASLKGFGELYKREDWIILGNSLLEKLQEQGKNNCSQTWNSSLQIAETLTALQMVYPSIENSPWDYFWGYLGDTWHHRSCCYAGAPLKELQEKEEPHPNLYDLYLGYLSGSYSSRALLHHPYHLHAALIQPCEDPLPVITYPLTLQGMVNDQEWFLYQDSDFAIALTAKPNPLNSASDKGFHYLRIVWGDHERTHTFVSQGGNSSLVKFKRDKEKIELYFTLNEEMAHEQKEKNREVAFYYDLQEGAKTTVNGLRATTFLLGDLLNFSSGPFALSLKFSLMQGMGHFFGHLMPGNRPGQLDLKGKNRFQAFDNQIFLRSVSRNGPCTIKAEINIIKITE